MTELKLIAYMGVCGILFAFGGTIDPVWRRIGIPVATAVFLVVGGATWWRILPAMLFQWWILSQGYGQHSTWLQRTLVAIGFALPAVITLKPTIWTALTPAWFLSMYWLSNSQTFASQVPWKLVEFGTGVFISFTFVGAL